jgi:hypothetical protein
MNCPHCGKPVHAHLTKDAHQPGPPQTYDHDEAAALLRFGVTVGEVAALYGVTPQAISQLRKKRNIPSARSSRPIK